MLFFKQTNGRKRLSTKLIPYERKSSIYTGILTGETIKKCVALSAEKMQRQLYTSIFEVIITYLDFV